MTTEIASPLAPPANDVMPVHGIDHLELFVGNAAQAAYYYTHALGFTETAYRGLETGTRDRVSHVLEQGRIRLVLTGTLSGDDVIGEHHKRHGDGVWSIALSVPDAKAAYEHAVAHGARGIDTPYELSDEHGSVTLASIETYGETRHVFVERDGYQGAFLPGFDPRGTRAAQTPDGLFVGIDHVVGNVPLGHMDEWVRYYERVFGMTEMIHFSDEEISTEYSALMSKVVTDGSAGSSSRSTSPPRARRSHRSTSTSSSTGAPASSTSRCRARTSCAPSTSSSGAASSSSRSPRSTTTTFPSGSARSRRI
jgi:4-hydroxyphenylpyruvate dioxygenase